MVRSGDVARRIAWVIGFLAVVLAPAAAQAFPEHIYVNIPDLGPCGPVTAKGHERQFEALTIQEDIANEITVGAAAGGSGTTKATVKTFTLVKAIDGCSTALFMRLVRGQPLPLMTIDFVRNDGVTFASIRLDQLFITDVKVTGSGDSPVELVTVVPAGKFTYTVKRFNANGSVSTDQACWDFVRNSGC